MSCSMRDQGFGSVMSSLVPQAALTDTDPDDALALLRAAAPHRAG